MAVNDDAGGAFFALRQRSVAIGVQQVENLAAGLAAQAILKHFHLHARGILLPQMSGELDFLMKRVVAVDKSADKSNHDDAR